MGAYEDRDWHCHVNLARPSYFDDGTPEESPHKLDDVLGVLGTLNAKRGFLHVVGRFVISRDTLPEKGIVCGIADVSARLGSAELIFTGAEMEIAKASPYRKLDWSIEDGRVSGKITAAKLDFAFSDSYLVDCPLYCPRLRLR